MHSIINKAISALFGYLARAAARESQSHPGSRTLVYSRLARRVFYAGACIGVLVFTLAVESEPEPKKMGMACVLGILLLLPLALAGAEVFLTRITYDDTDLRTSSPWRASRRIPWTAVTECVVTEGGYDVILRTQGYGQIKMNLFMRGTGELIEETALRVFARDAAAPEVEVTVIKPKDRAGMLLGCLFILLGGGSLALSTILVDNAEASAFTTMDGEVLNHQRTITEKTKSSFIWFREAAKGPLRPDLVRPEMHCIFGGIPDSFSELDYAQSLRRGARITLTVLKKDADRIKINGSSMASPMRAVALRIGNRDCRTLAQYLESQRQDQWVFLLFGAGSIILGIVLWRFLGRRQA